VRQINPRHHNVLEAEIKPGQHHLRFSITARVCSSMVSGNLPGASGLSGDKKTASTAALQLCVTAGCLRTFAAK
jgi:hypothetical protein